MWPHGCELPAFLTLEELVMEIITSCSKMPLDLGAHACCLVSEKTSRKSLAVGIINPRQCHLHWEHSCKASVYRTDPYPLLISFQSHVKKSTQVENITRYASHRGVFMRFQVKGAEFFFQLHHFYKLRNYLHFWTQFLRRANRSIH